MKRHRWNGPGEHPLIELKAKTSVKEYQDVVESLFEALERAHDGHKGVHGPYRTDFRPSCGLCKSLAQAEDFMTDKGGWWPYRKDKVEVYWVLPTHSDTTFAMAVFNTVDEAQRWIETDQAKASLQQLLDARPDVSEGHWEWCQGDGHFDGPFLERL